MDPGNIAMYNLGDVIDMAYDKKYEIPLFGGKILSSKDEKVTRIDKLYIICEDGTLILKGIYFLVEYPFDNRGKRIENINMMSRTPFFPDTMKKQYGYGTTNGVIYYIYVNFTDGTRYTIILKSENTNGCYMHIVPHDVNYKSDIDDNYFVITRIDYVPDNLTSFSNRMSKSAI